MVVVRTIVRAAIRLVIGVLKKAIIEVIIKAAVGAITTIEAVRKKSRVTKIK